MLLILLASLVLQTQIACANPTAVPSLRVDLPVNNKIYPSNQVELNFTVIDPFFNYTDFSYSLDGKQPQQTNPSCVLTGLSSGSHTLTIYGNYSSADHGSGNRLLTKVYFSVNYSTAWVNFALILAAVLVPAFLLLFLGRKRIANRLKRQKTGGFWLGVVCFVFFAVFIFAPSVWHWADKYLYPQFETGFEGSPVFGIVFSASFMILSIFFMWFGTRKGKSLESKLKKVLEN
jgi:hypothetical protein